MAVDATSASYTVGESGSTDFPVRGGLQAHYHGDSDAFVSKLNPTGTALVYSTYLGGSAYDLGTAIAVDASGNADVTGYTQSQDFPLRHPLQGASGGGYDAFVAKLNPAGDALIYSTYLGGIGNDGGFGIATDAIGNTYVTGSTRSANFPVRHAVQAALHAPGTSNAFVAKIDSSGTALLYSTYLGGSGGNDGDGIAVTPPAMPMLPAPPYARPASPQECAAGHLWRRERRCLDEQARHDRTPYLQHPFGRARV